MSWRICLGKNPPDTALGPISIVTVGGGLGMSHGNEETHPRLADTIGFIAPDIMAPLCVWRSREPTRALSASVTAQ